MPKAYKLRPLKSRRRSRLPARRRFYSRAAIIYVGLVITISGFLLVWIIMRILSPTTLSYPEGDSVVGRPTIDAEMINRVLERYHSPARNKGQALYDYGVQYGIDPAYALAFFMHESTFGTKGVAKVTHSLGNIRATSGYAEYNGYRKYKTWEEGFEDWYRLISQLYVGKWGLSTIDQIIPVYAPSADNNDEGAYISSVKAAVQTWRSGSVEI